MCILFVIIGAIFYGIRKFIMQISDLSQQALDNYYLSHIIGYFTYFIICDIFKFLLVDYFIRFMIFLQNPPSD